MSNMENIAQFIMVNVVLDHLKLTMHACVKLPLLLWIVFQMSLHILLPRKVITITARIQCTFFLLLDSVCLSRFIVAIDKIRGDDNYARQHPKLVALPAS